jgi:serine/threonine protein kinase
MYEIYAEMNGKILEELKKIQGIESIIEVEGAGQSFAYSAYDKILDRKIFLKVIWFSEKYKDSLLLEPRKLTSLFNRNEQSRMHIVGIFSAESITIEDNEFIVLRMEYCEGTDLSKGIGVYGNSIKESISIAKEICEGIHFLHSLNIAHRDIKPANVMVGSTRAKIIDLGSALEILNDEWKPVSSAKTLLYSPPETLNSNKQYGKVSDIYQIGAVLWEMIFGRFEFDRIPEKLKLKVKKSIQGYSPTDGYLHSLFENQLVYMLASKNELFPNLVERSDHIPLGLIKILKKATSFDPQKRYQSCASLRSELSRENFPDWHKLSENEYMIQNWKGKDYRTYIQSNKRSTEFVFEYSNHGANSFRRNSKVKNIQDVIKEING